MHEGLFRAEVVRNRSRRLTGDLIIKTAVSARLLVFFLVVVVLAALFYLAGNTYTRKQTVSGMLMPDKGLIDIYPAVNGKITEVYIKQGDVLDAGRLLFTVAEDHGQLNEIPVVSMLNQNLSSRRMLVQEQLEQLDSAYGLAMKRHELKLEALATALNQEQKILDAELAMLEIQTKSLSRANRLAAQKVLPDSDLEAREYEVLAQRTRIETRKGNMLTMQSSFDQEALAQKESDVSYQEKRTALQQRMNDIAAEAINLEARAGTEVVAPVNGLVSQVNVHQGMAVNTQQPLLSLLPENSRLQAWLQVPASAIGFLRQGQVVKIRYTTFAYQKFGVFEGVISVVPENAVVAESVTGEPFYRVVADIGIQSVQAYGDEFPLRAGTSLNADIVLDRRNLLEWLLEPLYSIGLRS